MKNQVRPEATTIPLTAPYAVESGGAALIGARVFISLAKLANGEIGQFTREGEYTYAKATGTGTGGAQGALVYWDNTAKVFTAVSTSNTLAGFFTVTAGNNDTTCQFALT
jgi:predicted RecA/RadA family phage recombinase